MTVGELVDELLNCNQKQRVSFCHVEEVSKLETECEDEDTWVTIYGDIETVSRHKQGVVLGFKEG